MCYSSNPTSPKLVVVNLQSNNMLYSSNQLWRISSWCWSFFGSTDFYLNWVNWRSHCCEFVFPDAEGVDSSSQSGYEIPPLLAFLCQQKYQTWGSHGSESGYNLWSLPPGTIISSTDSVVQWTSTQNTGPTEILKYTSMKMSDIKKCLDRVCYNSEYHN